MINGVLVERTVKDVVPALKTNSEGLKKVLDELLKQYKLMQDDMEKWKVCVPVSNISFYPSAGIHSDCSAEEEQHSSGTAIVG
jgi:hypothetical protein